MKNQDKDYGLVS